MEDRSSVDSNESVSTSEEYEIIPKTVLLKSDGRPQLSISGSGGLDHLQKCIDEILDEEKEQSSINKNMTDKNESYIAQLPKIPEDILDNLGIIQKGTMFGGISYLGSASITQPKDKSEILRIMSILNRERVSGQDMKISVSIPVSSEGAVILFDSTNNTIIARYEIERIMFYANGVSGTKEASCFAFSWAHGDSEKNALFQCHVFKCSISEAVNRVSTCFVKAFQKESKTTVSTTSPILDSRVTLDMQSKNGSTEIYIFEVSLEIKEDDGKGTFVSVPRDKNFLKLRANVEKQVCLTVNQVVSNTEQKILQLERCFGVLVCHGRNVKQSDMQLLDMVSMGTDLLDTEGNITTYIITGHWDPSDKVFEPLNSETQCSYITVAVDLVMQRIKEPVRLSIETPIKVYGANERFWVFGRRQVTHQFYLNLQQINIGTSEAEYKLLNIDNSGEMDKSRLNLTLNNLANFIRAQSINSIEMISPKDENLSDNDEPLISGTGDVSKECNELELESWKDVLLKWVTCKSPPARQLAALVKEGIPEALRGEVWLRLAKGDLDPKLMDTYRILLTKECDCGGIIQRDIHRTFPAHDFFKEAGGIGQDNLFHLTKAYAVYDTEVGYCQGLTFLAATLLLHMPEEQAFCVLLKLMYDYGLREFYKDGFETVYLKLYQLNKLMEEQIPQLYNHFNTNGIEAHMYASQWFLTLFTARFPLFFVFRIMDVILLQGLDTLFQVAIALLQFCKKDLLQLDFENILKYFRVTMPKKVRNDEVAKQLIKNACAIKLKKLKKYEQQFLTLKEAQENAESFTSELDQVKMTLKQTEEEKNRLEEELTRVKNILKKEINKADSEITRDQTIIKEYKQICQRLDAEQASMRAVIKLLKNTLGECSKCRSFLENPLLNNDSSSKSSDASTSQTDESKLSKRITELEIELAQTKLALVESECRNQAPC
ncbi:rab GTPase-activating protein 1-like isoform X2 [Daktulosphaira vitifoliae]|uniref:rab GTPase-activating protein 1-like isoform X2 n=1 Tax=Daktulosphaira vitifoliae TaxID=58002 RepID=UPI0021AAD17D|nr:rab GTPase-activating protein 1-like isoform X2 [Daktulosphaira vitifoliae]